MNAPEKKPKMSRKKLNTLLIIVLVLMVAAYSKMIKSEISEYSPIDQNAENSVTAKKEQNDTVKNTQPSKTDAEIRAEYIQSCEAVSYSDVERNPKTYEGKNVKVDGTVIQVSEGWLNTTLRIESNEGIWYATYKRNNDESRILENDIITAYGECTGVETYKTLLGANMTIPGMEIKYYETTEKYPISDDTAKYTEGQHKVGTDIPAGQYMLIQTGSSSAYYSITSDANGNDIINNDNFKNHSIVEVMDGEYISLSRCYAVPLADAPVVSSYDGYLGDGCYIVGRDIAAGEYKIESTEEVSAYVCIYPDVRRTKIISNDNFSGSRYISVENGQMIEINRGRISVGEQ